MKTSKTVLGSVVVLGAILAIASLAQDVSQVKSKKPSLSIPPLSAVGSWFGIARPCPADPVADSPTHAAFCQAVCGLCPSIPNTLPPEVPMMPIFVSDGTVTADDAGEIGRYHTTAHGHWVVSGGGDGIPDWQNLPRYKATFFWLGSSYKQGGFPGDPASTEPYGTCCFNNSVRPRFVAYFDSTDPDRMIGFIQPYATAPGTFVDPATGLVIVNPLNPQDPKAGNHIPAAPGDLLGGSLPAGCQNNLGCLGTYHFIIRRIKEE